MRQIRKRSVDRMFRPVTRILPGAQVPESASGAGDCTIGSNPLLEGDLPEGWQKSPELILEFAESMSRAQPTL